MALELRPMSHYCHCHAPRHDLPQTRVSYEKRLTVMNVLCSNGRSLCLMRFGVQHRLMATEVQNYFPFPMHANPTPHEIFHLRKGCSQSEIKNRYYELVRAYHPDAPYSREIPPEIRHKRFQSISAAYDVLRGKSVNFKGGSDSIYEEELKRRKQAFYAAAAARGNWDEATFTSDPYMYASGGRRWNPPTAEDVWKDRTIIWGSVFLAILTFVPFMYHSPYSGIQKNSIAAKENYAAARADAKLFGRERVLSLKEEAQRRRFERTERDKRYKDDDATRSS